MNQQQARTNFIDRTTGLKSELILIGDGVMSNVDDILRPGRRMGFVSHSELLVILIKKSSVLWRLPNFFGELWQWFNPLVSAQVIKEGIRVSAATFWSHNSVSSTLEFVVAQNLVIFNANNPNTND